MDESRRLGLASMGVVLALTGCGLGKHYEQGRAAERRGEVHLAYEEYCEAAREQPTNEVLTTAIQRVAPTAATYWHALAKIAEAQGRVQEAVQMSLRCLTIKPDHGAALADIRALRGEEVSEPVRPERDQLEVEAVVLAAAPVVTVKDEAMPPPDDAPKPTSQPASPAGEAVETPMPATAPAMASAEIATTEPTLPEIPTLAAIVEPPPPVAEQGYFGGDKPRDTHPRPQARRHAVADVFIELVRVEDTAVALNLYDGDRRIQEIRDLRIGRSKLFRSRSRRWYRLTIISAHQRTGSVRIGIEPA